MNVTELQDALTVADIAYVEKTHKQPYIGSRLILSQNDKGWTAYLYEKNSNGGMGGSLSGEPSDAPESAISNLVEKINAMPSLDEQHKREIQKDLGALIDKSRDYGLAVDFLNPLTETMKRLSENILEHHSTPADRAYREASALQEAGR